MIVLWVRSFPGYRVVVGEANIMLLVAPDDTGRWALRKDDDAKAETLRWNYLVRNCDRSAKALGFEFLRGREPAYGFPYWIVLARYWSLALLAAVLPFAWVFGALRRHRRHSKSRCRVCNYDIRATPDRCPECGTVPGNLPPAQMT